MDEEPDLVAIELVVLDGHRMPLLKEDRIEAIKLMTSRDISREIMAWRLCMTVLALQRFANRSELKLTPVRPSAHWTSPYIANRNEAHRRRRVEQKRKARKQATTPRETA